MATQVKICPACKHKNSELDFLCQNCNALLDNVAPQPDPDQLQEPSPPLPQNEHSQPWNAPLSEPPPPISEPPPVQKQASHASRVTNRYMPDAPLFLELPDRVIEIQSNDVLGQAHPESRATKQLSNISGVNHLHRQHCSFICAGGQWHVTAIPNEKFTNPSWVNGVKVQPGSTMPLRDGDQLKLCGITFRVRVQS